MNSWTWAAALNWFSKSSSATLRWPLGFTPLLQSPLLHTQENTVFYRLAGSNLEANSMLSSCQLKTKLPTDLPQEIAILCFNPVREKICKSDVGSQLSWYQQDYRNLYGEMEISSVWSAYAVAPTMERFQVKLGHPLAIDWCWKLLEALLCALVQHNHWMNTVTAAWCVFANLSLGLCRKPSINAALWTSSLKFCTAKCRGEEVSVRMVGDVSGCSKTVLFHYGWLKNCSTFPTLLWKSSRSAVSGICSLHCGSMATAQELHRLLWALMGDTNCKQGLQQP